MQLVVRPERLVLGIAHARHVGAESAYVLSAEEGRLGRREVRDGGAHHAVGPIRADDQVRLDAALSVRRVLVLQVRVGCRREVHAHRRVVGLRVGAHRARLRHTIQTRVEVDLNRRRQRGNQRVVQTRTADGQVGALIVVAGCGAEFLGREGVHRMAGECTSRHERERATCLMDVLVGGAAGEYVLHGSCAVGCEHDGALSQAATRLRERSGGLKQAKVTEARSEQTWRSEARASQSAVRPAQLGWESPLSLSCAVALFPFSPLADRAP